MTVTRKEFYADAAIISTALAIFVSPWAALTFIIATWIIRTC